MKRLVIALALANIGCEAKPAPATSSLGEAVARAPAEVAQSAQSAAAVADDVRAGSSEYYTVEDLRGLGLRVTSLAEGETLVCGSEADSQCICLMPLDCGSGACIHFSENVQAFRTALSHSASGRKVQCERAAVGDCGVFKYFDFQGDLYRREVRWFDASGALVGQRNLADYAAYCGKQTRSSFAGRIPRCVAATSRELLCGEQPATLSPLDDLRRYAGPRAKPTATPRQ